MATDCSQNTDPLTLVREGTQQDQRAPAALSPDAAPVDARTVAHDIVFAQSYAGALKHYGADNAVDGDWRAYFGTDAAVPLAIASIEDVDAYKARVREWFDFLNSLDNAPQAEALKDRLGYLYAAVGAVAVALDDLGGSLPADVPLKGTLSNLVRTQLAPALARLVAYYKGGVGLGVVNAVAPAPVLTVLRHDAQSFATVLGDGLSADWSGGANWATYVAGIAADASVYGAGGTPAPDPFMRINHCATHNLFKSVFDQFLKVLMRVVGEAQAGLADTLGKQAGHAPHYALFVAFLQLLAYARGAGNTLTQRHLDFYYATILGLKPRPAQPGHVHLVAELARQAGQFDFAAGQRFKAGKDATGKPAFFANLGDVVANKGAVASLKSVYRHGAEVLSSGDDDRDRLFASPIANSADGQGAPLATPDQSWHPFYEKRYVDGTLASIDMPLAQVGFGIASHYLLAAEGSRHITVTLTLHDALPAGGDIDLSLDADCLLSTAKGWMVKTPKHFRSTGSRSLELYFELDGGDEAVVPYSAKVHGGNFDTALPMLLVMLRQDTTRRYAYAAAENLAIDAIALQVKVDGLRTLAVSSDFGPVDLSKPFQPFGVSPVTGSGLVIGAKEVFQKTLSDASIDLRWQVAPAVFPASASVPTAKIDALTAGGWVGTGLGAVSIVPASGSDSVHIDLGSQANGAVLDAPDFTGNEPYGTSSRQGFVRLQLNGDVGQAAYQSALVAYLRKDENATDPGPKPPQGPVAASLTLNYLAGTTLPLNSNTADAYANRTGRFFHVAPFGTAERHPYLSGGTPVPLLPPFRVELGGATVSSEAEFYIGVAGLLPPQNLSVLFQVADGTANPLARKPVPHIGWSYLADERWVAFPENAVVDTTGGLLNSGIVTFAMPGDATADNRLMPAGQYWIRAAVHEASDAVCRLKMVAAQALEAVFVDQGNDPAFSSTPLPPGTVTQLAVPDAAVKSLAQPFPSFGGRGAERPTDFYRRVSERLRHKDRAIALWDIERLVLEAFPQVFKVKCLNHTQYEPADNEGGGLCSGGIYRELAPGHITVVTLPDLRAQQQIDPLKPYTSLGVLADVQAYLARRCSGFAQLHVKNPQFEELRVSFALKLRDGYDEAYYRTQLQQAITRFLSPWAFDGTGVPSFGGTIHKSALIHFVESQPCVDYVTDFCLYQDIPCQPPGSVDLDEAAGSRAVSILVSAPAGRHQITVIKPAPDPALAESCGCDA